MSRVSFVITIISSPHFPLQLNLINSWSDTRHWILSTLPSYFAHCQKMDSPTKGVAPAEEVALTPESLALKVAAADQQYAKKNYADAAELYSEATVLQAELRGEMAPENADLLYAYGRCLYHVAISKSDVLGSRVAGSEQKKESNNQGRQKRKREDDEDAHGGTGESTKKPKQDEPTTENKPYFQITGDGEDWSEDDSDEDGGEETGEAGPGGEEDEEDDFATAYEILDMARVLLQRQIVALEEKDDKESLAITAQTKERLADTHDLQGEISLENERFTDAVNDSRAALELKTTLFPFDSAIVAEAHYKLSLALEFNSAAAGGSNTVADAAKAAGMVLGNQGAGQVTAVDATMRREAAEHMSQAIASSKARVKKEKAAIADVPSDAEKRRKEASIADVEDIIKDMQTRVSLLCFCFLKAMLTSRSTA